MDRKAIVQVEDVCIVLKNVVKGSAVSSAKHSAKLIINGNNFKCILREKRYVDLDRLYIGISDRVIVSFFKQVKTKYTEKGYVVLLLTLTQDQFWVYIKREDLGRFFNSILLGG